MRRRRVSGEFPESFRRVPGEFPESFFFLTGRLIIVYLFPFRALRIFLTGDPFIFACSRCQMTVSDSVLYISRVVYASSASALLWLIFEFEKSVYREYVVKRGGFLRSL